PEAPARVENDVVRPLARLAIAFRIEHLHLAGREVNSLNAAARIVRRRQPIGHQLSRFSSPGEPPVVADVYRSFPSPPGPFGPAPHCGDHLDGSFRSHARKRSTRNLDEDDTTVIHRDRTFREGQSRRNFPYHVVTSPIGKLPESRLQLIPPRT